MLELTRTASVLPSVTATATPGNPVGGGLPGEAVASHGFFWYFIVFAIELASLAGIAILTRYTVQYRSGLTDPEKVRRIWARAPEIRFQPVKRPLVFAVATSFGAQTVLHALVAAFFSFLGFVANAGTPLGFIISYAALAGSALISVVVYRVSGGTNWKLCAAATTGFGWFMTGILMSLALGLFKLGGDSIPPFLMFCIVTISVFIVLALIQTPFFIWGAYKRLPSTAAIIYNNSVVPNWVKLDRTMLMVAGPLAVIRFIVFYLSDSILSPSYLSRIISSFAVIMLLSSCALASIISVNRALLANEFQWQWRAFLTPAVPLVIVDIVASLFSLIFVGESLWWAAFQIPHMFFSYGSSGALGAIVYLKLAEKYAQTHIDDDVLAQNDLLTEFEEDEDNEELEV